MLSLNGKFILYEKIKPILVIEAFQDLIKSMRTKYMF